MAQNNTADLKTYSKAWYDKMVTIWRDRIDAMDILDTGALRGSVAGKGFSMDEMGGQMAFQFLQYGIFVDLGTGKGYKRGNGGDLKFLAKITAKSINLEKHASRARGLANRGTFRRRLLGTYMRILLEKSSWGLWIILNKTLSFYI